MYIYVHHEIYYAYTCIYLYIYVFTYIYVYNIHLFGATGSRATGIRVQICVKGNRGPFNRIANMTAQSSTSPIFAIYLKVTVLFRSFKEEL